MKVYISGIVRSTGSAAQRHEQEYRARIEEVLAARYRNVEIASPGVALLAGGTATAERELFFSQIQKALMADLVIAYLPKASMGSAIEIWEAYKNSRPVIIISPLVDNWTVRFLPARVFPDLESFLAFAREGGLDPWVLDRYEAESGKRG